MDDSNGAPDTSSQFEDARREMVARQIAERGIRDERVLEAMRSIPRHLFVPGEYVNASYRDEPLPIGERQSISQPFMVAAMAEALLLKGSERVLEIGGGSGYQAAVLSLLVNEVIAIEAHPALAASAGERLARLGYTNAHVEQADGSMGWAQNAPYDAILVTAAAPAVPPPLVGQLAEGGRLVLPVGGGENQELIRITKSDGRTSQESLYACRFVPLVGRYGWQDRQTQRG
ncbi:MAG TPA: protein-L-isoaspartate(D-aspartate) O-methyltransferase [Candidatus Acidoferrum sp.]|nr:protein-L-isoaspartate(D-aspartate) O-methyltransferase [Candidatus Acidoferrum sp.]